MPTIAEKLTTIADNQQKVYDAGKEAEYNEFWDNFQLNGVRRGYAYAFYSSWNDSYYNPKYPIITEEQTQRARYMYYFCGITDTKVPIEINGRGTITEEAIFSNCKRLKTIRELYINNYGGAYTDWFKECTSLENITIKGKIKNNGFDIHWSTKLTAESIYSIISALSSTVSGCGIILPSTAEATYNKKPPANAPKTFKELKETKMNWVISLL